MRNIFGSHAEFPVELIFRGCSLETSVSFGFSVPSVTVYGPVTTLREWIIQ